MKLRLRQKKKLPCKNLLNWNEFAGRTKKDTVSEEICRIALILRLRQKMKVS